MVNYIIFERMMFISGLNKLWGILEKSLELVDDI